LPDWQFYAILVLTDYTNSVLSPSNQSKATTMPSEPQPCPFAHPISHGSRDEQINGYWHVVCRDCGATGPERKTLAEAIKAWNARRKPSGDGGKQ